jgi:hypothetical protein
MASKKGFSFRRQNFVVFMKWIYRISIMKVFPEEDRLIFLKWALIGLLVRLAFMPFTLHGDLVGINKFAFLLTHRGHIPLARMDYPPLAYFSIGFFQFLFRPLMPDFGYALDSGNPLWGESPHFYRYLFLLKFPYLIFDFGIAFLLLRLVKNREKRLAAFKLWMLNPLIIFACYLHGQFDIMPTFLVVLSLYYVWREKLTASFILLGIGASLKQFPFLFLIPALILLGRTKLQKFAFLLGAVVPYLLLTSPYWKVSGFRQILTTGGGYDERVLGLYVGIGSHRVYIFVIGYVIILAFIYFHSFIRDSKDALGKLLLAELVICLWFYATVFFHPQWVVWMMPMLTLFVVGQRKLTTLYWLLIICVFVYTAVEWGGLLTTWLFSPIDRVFFHSLISLGEIISYFYPSRKFLFIFHSIFIGISFWLMYQAFRSFFPREEQR